MGNNAVQAAIIGLRDADWLSGMRALAYARILASVSAAGALLWIALSHGGLDLTGKPLGTDFISFWAASKLALSGHPALVYDIAAHHETQTAVFGVDTGYYAFFYPPVYLLVCLPLALAPYGTSLAAWLTLTGYGYWRAVCAVGGERSGLLLPALAFPAVLSTAGHGQNALLSAALFGGGVALLDRRPVLAGLLFGALIYKPHLGLMIPVFLLLGGRWKTFLAAAVTALSVAALSVIVFGTATWQGFFDIAPLARATLERDWVGADKMVSTFAAVRLWHGGITLAYAAQGLTALFAVLVMARVVRSRAPVEAQGSVLVMAALLASPFLLDYDLTLLALPLAWMLVQARRTGFKPWEKAIMLAGFLLPLLSRLLAHDIALPLGPPVLVALSCLVLRRALGAVTVPTHRNAHLPDDFRPAVTLAVS